MDNHPIPQDVTNFQFRLIGDMTLKQFAYVAGGVILAWLMLASPLLFLFKFFLAGASILSGVILAFVPIDGRPSDVMVFHFIKALFSPTQYIYRKAPQIKTAQPPQQVVTSQTPIPVGKKEEKKSEEKVSVSSFAPTATAAIATHEQTAADTTTQHAAITNGTISTQLDASPHVPSTPTNNTTNAEKETQQLQEEVEQLTDELTQAKEQEHTAQAGTAASMQAHGKVTDLEKQLQEVLIQKQQLEKQLVALQQSLAEKKQQVFSPTVAHETPKTTQHVKQIPKQMSTGVGTPLVPDVPNLLTGIVKDPRGNVLGNILIEVKDKDGNPVRAFKTNQLGQFAAATPLANGVYTISFEDPAGKQSFDTVEITAQGNILMPMEVISVDARERLRQELFGGNTST